MWNFEFLIFILNEMEIYCRCKLKDNRVVKNKVEGEEIGSLKGNIMVFVIYFDQVQIRMLVKLDRFQIYFYDRVNKVFCCIECVI